MKKVRDLRLKSKLDQLEKISEEEANKIKGGYSIYYPNYSNPSNSVSYNPGNGGSFTHTWRF